MSAGAWQQQQQLVAATTTTTNSKLTLDMELELEPLLFSKLKVDLWFAVRHETERILKTFMSSEMLRELESS